MSLFFQNVEKVKPENRSLELLSKHGCQLCPLLKEDKVQPHGSKNPLIYILGDFPTPSDIDEGEYLTGQQGDLIHKFIPRDYLSKIRYNCIVRSETNQIGEREIACCRNSVVKDIEEAAPTAIIGLGGDVLDWSLGHSAIIDWRGRRVLVTIGKHTCWYYPILHPTWLLEKIEKNKYGTDIYEHITSLDFRKIFAEIDNLPKPEIVDLATLNDGVKLINGNLQDVTDFFDKYENTKTGIGFDIETKNLRPYENDSKILTMSFSTGDETIAFPIDHKQAKWTRQQKQDLNTRLKQFFTKRTNVLIAHNCFSGDTEIITDTGLKKFSAISGTSVNVWTKNGWVNAPINNFGKQKLKELVLVPYNRSRSSIKHKIYVTDEHNWMAERKHRRWCKGYHWEEIINAKTKDLKVNDRIPFSAPNDREPNEKSVAFKHGLIFADGSLIKNRVKENYFPHNLRFCGNKNKYSSLFTVTYPKSANGDAVCNWYVSEFNCKELPITEDPKYIQDFIEAWSLFDGTKLPCENTRSVTTIERKFADWLKKYAPLGGWVVTGFSDRKSNITSTGEVFSITLSKDKNLFWSVKEINDTDRYEDVYCATVPNEHEFTLSNGVYTKNCCFEQEWCSFFYGKEVLRSANWADTQIQAYSLDERYHNGMLKLDTLCLMKLGFNLKEQSNIDVLNLDNIDINKVLKYNAYDAKYTQKLCKIQHKEIKEQNLLSIYNQHIRLIPTLVQTQADGLPIDQIFVSKTSKELEVKLDTILADIRNTDIIKQVESRLHHEFNPLSGDDKLVLLRDYLKVPILKKTKKGNDSLDKELLGTVDHPIAKKIINYSEMGKIKSTYIDPLLPHFEKSVIHSDGLVHTNLNSMFTITSRLSADQPNIQNYPNRNNKELIRPAFIAPPGHTLVSVDYGQIEARVIAMYSKDKVFVNALWHDLDVHQDWAEKISNAYPKALGNKDDLKAMKKLRNRVKNKWVFPSFFGAGKRTVAGYMNIPFEVIEPLFDEFWKEFSGVHKWQKEIKKFYDDNGYVEFLNGRRRRGPLKFQDICNHPVQGVTANLMCDAYNRISEKAEIEGKPWLQPKMQIHDDLTYFIPNEKLEDSLEEIISVMLKFDYPWINVPITVEIECGSNWYNKESIGTFKSNEWFQ